MPDVPHNDALIGQTIGSFQLVSRIGAGGMGEVYLAQDDNLRRRVALKLLPADAAADPERLSRFHAEARLASSLNHPHILVIHDFGDHEGRPFMVTEFVEGVTLRQRLAAGPFALPETVEIASQMASALAAAHARGVVHRDIKPDNVMLRPDGYVKVLDFGLAKLAAPEPDAESMLLTRPGVLMGTLPYMSPEQLRAEQTDARTDIYSFGVLLFELVSGRLPFNAPTTADLVAVILGQDPPPLSRFVVDVPADLERLVASALAKDAAARPSSMAHVLAALTEVRRSFSPETRVSAVAGSRVRADMPRTNLPADLTPLVGRGPELEQLTHVLRDRGVRLLSVTGAGGTGKTRLAIAAAGLILNDFADGVFFVALGSIADPALLPSAMARGLGLAEVPGEAVEATLQGYMASRELLMVMDNFEQLIASAPVITRLLASAPLLKVLITSQAALRVRGEREFPVQPLPLPGAKDTLEMLRGNPAVALLVSRTKDVNPAFELTPENAAALVEICRRLDGLPLAIELAAARLKVLSPAAALRKLDAPLAFLTAGASDLPARQQTMRSAIAWSYAQLTLPEQTLFRRLAVFSGGCTTEAVETVCAIESASDESLLERFASIVDKNLVRADHDDTGEPRFSMLATIRGFATELFQPTSDAPELRRRHAVYFAALAEAAEPELHGGGGAPWFGRLDRELHNIGAALTWCIEASERDLGFRLAGGLLPFWLRRGHLAEGRGYLSRLLDLDGDPHTPARLKALYAAGVLAQAQGEFPEARSYLEQNLEAHRALGDPWGVGNALNNLGVVCITLKEYAAARALYGESGKIWNTLGNLPAIALGLQNLGNVARLEQRFGESRAFYEQSLATFRGMSDELGVAKSLNLLSDLAREEGDLDRASALAEESLDIFMKLTEHREVAGSLSDLGRIARERHDPAEAHSLFHESLLIYQQLGDPLGMAQMFDALAMLAAAHNHPEDAIRIAGAAARLRGTAGSRLSPDEASQLEQWLQPVRQALGNARVAGLWNQGAALSADEAIAVSERSPVS